MLVLMHCAGNEHKEWEKEEEEDGGMRETEQQ